MLVRHEGHVVPETLCGVLDLLDAARGREPQGVRRREPVPTRETNKPGDRRRQRERARDRGTHSPKARTQGDPLLLVHGPPVAPAERSRLRNKTLEARGQRGDKSPNVPHGFWQVPRLSSKQICHGPPFFLFT